MPKRACAPNAFGAAPRIDPCSFALAVLDVPIRTRAAICFSDTANQPSALQSLEYLWVGFLKASKTAHSRTTAHFRPRRKQIIAQGWRTSCRPSFRDGISGFWPSAASPLGCALQADPRIRKVVRATGRVHRQWVGRSGPIGGRRMQCVPRNHRGCWRALAGRWKPLAPPPPQWHGCDA